MAGKPHRTPLCRDCSKQLGKHKGHGYCTRCAGKHRCKVCNEVNQPAAMAIASLCWGCQVTVDRMAEAHEEPHANQHTPDPLAWNERIESLAERAAAGLPLFPEPREKLPRPRPRRHVYGDPLRFWLRRLNGDEPTDLGDVDQ